jgi:YHS domain-containing protein
MTIASDTAAERLARAGAPYHFRSPGCRHVFEEHPDRAGASAPDAVPSTGSDAAWGAAGEPAEPRMEQHEPPYTTWGFLTSPKFGAAGSGGLECERLPEADRPRGH